MKSKKPKKQRVMLYNADLHTKHKFLSAHLSKDLAKRWQKRSLPIRNGDEVKVMRGEFKGTTGKVSRVDLKRTKIYVESIKRRRVSGEEVRVPLHPSNLLITNPSMDDKKRMAAVNRKGEKIVKNEKNSST